MNPIICFIIACTASDACEQVRRRYPGIKKRLLCARQGIGYRVRIEV